VHIRLVSSLSMPSNSMHGMYLGMGYVIISTTRIGLEIVRFNIKINSQNVMDNFDGQSKMTCQSQKFAAAATAHCLHYHCALLAMACIRVHGLRCFDCPAQYQATRMVSLLVLHQGTFSSRVEAICFQNVMFWRRAPPCRLA
jgi:hypothetical protein